MESASPTLVDSTICIFQVKILIFSIFLLNSTYHYVFRKKATQNFVIEMSLVISPYTNASRQELTLRIKYVHSEKLLPILHFIYDEIIQSSVLIVTSLSTISLCLHRTDKPDIVSKHTKNGNRLQKRAVSVSWREKPSSVRFVELHTHQGFIRAVFNRLLFLYPPVVYLQ